TLSVEHGDLQLLGDHDVLGPSGTLGVGLDSPKDYGTIYLSGAAALAGTLGIALNNGYVPVPGSSFPVLSCGSTISDNFIALSYVPPVVIWRLVYSSNALNVVAYPPISLLGTNVAINAAGAPGYRATLLTTTNLDMQLSNWMPVATNTFGVTGFLSFTNPLNFGNPQQFFALTNSGVGCKSGYNTRSCQAMLQVGCVTVTNADGQVFYDCNDEALYWLAHVGPNGGGCDLTGYPGGHCNSLGDLVY